MQKRICKFFIYVCSEPNEFILAVLFWTCLFLTLRWVSLPYMNLGSMLYFIFSVKHQPDNIVSGVVVGYVTGYGVYYLTSRRPTVKMRKPIREYAYKEMLSVYNKSIYLLLLACKCTATEDEWNEISQKTDIECFNETFYKTLQKFDIKKNGYTLMCDKETLQPILWGEYLYNCYDEMQKKYKEIFLNYEVNLDNELIKVIRAISECNYIELMLGETINTNYEWGGTDGKIYYEHFPIYKIYATNDLSPIFQENIKYIHEYIELLTNLYNFLKKRIQNEASKPDFSIKKIVKDNVGVFEEARV